MERAAVIIGCVIYWMSAGGPQAYSTYPQFNRDAKPWNSSSTMWCFFTSRTRLNIWHCSLKEETASFDFGGDNVRPLGHAESVLE